MFNKQFKTKAFRYLFLLASVFVFGLISISGSVYANTIEVDVEATVTCMFVLEPGDSVQFGNIYIKSGGDAGTVSIDKDTGEVTWNGGVVNVEKANSQLGSLKLVAPRPGELGITYPEQVNLTNNLDSSKNVVFSPAAAVNSVTITGYNEVLEIKVGGMLQLNANTMEGIYSGNVAITVDYI